jgi:hypothetical protein
MKSAKLTALLMLGSMSIAGFPARAGSHLWRFAEAFSNADGTIQFIELHESSGVDNGEIFVPGHAIASTTKNYTIPAPNLPATTANKRLLFATPAFAALPGAPTPDYTFPAGSVPFFSIVSDTLACTGWPSMIIGAGQLPTDGIHSLVCANENSCSGANIVVAINSPTNFAGQTGSVNASSPPPAVPDGSAGSTPMTVSKLNPDGTSLSIAFDTAACSGVTNRQIIYGQGSQLPVSPGGSFGLTGSACSVGGSPFTWNPAPDANPATGLVWWLLTVRDASNREGSWGKDSAAQERVGPGAGGSSGQCGVTTKNISNACGH